MDTTDQIKTPLILAFDYTVLKLLGEGANGKTWLGRSKVDGNLVAIKELKLAVMEDLKSLELFKREAETLQSITVPGVPRFYGSVFAEDYASSFAENGEKACYLIQEYVPYSSISEILESEGKFSEEKTLAIMEKLASILLILQTQYSPPIIHRDIKPSNLLCEADDINNIKLALIDFGAVANPQKRTGGSTIAGTFGYMAPEQLQGECSIQSDYYAMGATAVHMLTNVSPYTMPSDVFKLNYKPTLLEEAPKTSKYMIELLDFLLAAKASERPKDAKELLAAIKYVKNGKSPHTDSKAQNSPNRMDRQLSMLSNFMNKSYSSSSPTFLTTPDDSWIKVSGTARGFSMSGDGMVFIEYTYKYKDKIYVGLDSHPTIGGTMNNRNMRFPMSCKVSLNPDDPHISYITFINNCDFTQHPKEQ